METDRALAQALLCESFGAFGKIEFPYVKMGNIDSLNLFDPNELIIFAFYAQNKTRYRHALDIGANLGLHSILMYKAGWHVQSFEPDPWTFDLLCKNIQANTQMACARQCAVSTSTGTATFVRVNDNRTGSHLAGHKDSYGPREEFTVSTMDCRPLFDGVHFAKIDCEGGEADILLTTTPAQMAHLDCMVEVGNLQNAMRIYHHFNEIGVPLWSQKNEWRRVDSIEHMPISNKEGSLFIGHRAPFL